MNLVVVGVITFPLEIIHGLRPDQQLGKRPGIAMDEISVLWDVMHHAHAGLFQRLAPLGFDRPNELCEMKLLAGERGAPFSAAR